MNPPPCHVTMVPKYQNVLTNCQTMVPGWIPDRPNKWQTHVQQIIRKPSKNKFHHFGILLYQSEAERNHAAFKPIFKEDYY